MQQSILTKSGLSRLIENIFNTFAKEVHTHTVSQIEDFPKIPTSASDVGADVSGAASKALTDAKAYTDTEINELSASVNTNLDAKVPNTRTVNGKALSSNINLTASDVGADASGAADTALNNAKQYTDEQLATIPTEAATTDEIINFIGNGVSDTLIDYEVATVSEVQDYINV